MFNLVIFLKYIFKFDPENIRYFSIYDCHFIFGKKSHKVNICTIIVWSKKYIIMPSIRPNPIILNYKISSGLEQEIPKDHVSENLKRGYNYSNIRTLV